MDESILKSIAFGDVMPYLDQIKLNLGDLESTSVKPKSLAHFEQLFNYLRERDIKDRQDAVGNESKRSEYLLAKARRIRKLFLNHVHVNWILWDPSTAPFSALKLDLPLVSCLYHNFAHNKLSVLWCPSVYTTEYLDVLESKFHLLEPDPNVSKNVFGQFARHFPQIRSVIIENSALRSSHINPSQFLDFLSDLQNLTILNLHCSGFNADFYKSLQGIASVKTLHCLKIFEPPGRLKTEIDFRFLGSFCYLHEFFTNLVTNVEVPELLTMMKIRSFFTFYFMDKDEDVYTQAMIQKSDDLKYVVTLTDRNYNIENFIQAFPRTFDDLASVREHFRNLMSTETSHRFDSSSFFDFPDDSDTEFAKFLDNPKDLEIMNDYEFGDLLEVIKEENLDSED